MATKSQEREALEKIRKIVAGLGEDSYIGTAFEGCFEIAESNIDNDFACSMKERADRAEKEVNELWAEKNRLEEELAAKYAEIDNFAGTVLNLQNDLQEAKAKQLTPRLYERIWTMAYDQEAASKKQMLGFADSMAQLAETPQDKAFGLAVEHYKKAKADAENAAWIMEQVEKIKPQGC
jgi:hypothetical protein